MNCDPIFSGKTSAGIPVYVQRNPKCKNSGYMVLTRTGSRDEKEGNYGISHLLEHVVFRATKTKTSFQMAKEIEGAGGEDNAFTSKENTAFYALTISETKKVAKDFVADIIRNPLLAEKDTEMEKKIVKQEISMCENDPESYIMDLFEEVVWNGHDLGRDIAGTRASVDALTYKDLREYYEAKYKVPNLYVFAYGDVQSKDVVNWASDNFDDIGMTKENKRKKPTIKSSVYKHYKRKEDHCYVELGFRGFDAKSKEKYALRILSSILGSGSSSRLFQSVREEKALVYAIFNSLEQYTDCSTMGTVFYSTKDNVLEAIDTTIETFRKLKDEGLVSDELQRSKNLLKGALIRGSESTGNALYSLAKNTMLTGKPVTIDERLAALDAVTEEDVMKVADKIMRPNGINVVMFGSDVKSMKKFSVDQLDF